MGVVFVIKKNKFMLSFEVITLFPEVFENYLGVSILKRAQEKKKIKIKFHYLRNFVYDKHKTVDDKPYGGGPGMILKAEPIFRVLKKLVKFEARKNKLKNISPETKIVLLSPKGKQFNQNIADKFSKLKKLILICGHYEGFDERVKAFVDEEISIGPFVLTGGELPAMVVIDAVTRLIPGVIKEESLKQESFSFLKGKGGLPIQRNREYPQYTRPQILTLKDSFGNIVQLKTPKVLLSGNHQLIQEWRKKHCF